jgi:hypothetical protein
MVPKKGLEPPHPCGYMDLNHARLPIPPLRRQKLGCDLGSPVRTKLRLLFLPGCCQLSNRAERADGTGDTQIAGLSGDSWILARQEAFKVA